MLSILAKVSIPTFFNTSITITLSLIFYHSSHYYSLIVPNSLFPIDLVIGIIGVDLVYNEFRIISDLNESYESLLSHE